MIVVSNSSPLVALGAVGRLELLRNLYGAISIRGPFITRSWCEASVDPARSRSNRPPGPRAPTSAVHSSSLPFKANWIKAKQKRSPSRSEWACHRIPQLHSGSEVDQMNRRNGTTDEPNFGMVGFFLLRRLINAPPRHYEIASRLRGWRCEQDPGVRFLGRSIGCSTPGRPSG